MIDLKELLINSNYKTEIEELINISNLSLKHWQTYWTGFNSTFVCEEILKEFNNLNDYRFFVFGGYASAQRSKIACFREDNIPDEHDLIRNYRLFEYLLLGNLLLGHFPLGYCLL